MLIFAGKMKSQKPKRIMNSRFFLKLMAALLLAMACVVPASAQSRAVQDRYHRTNTYGDVVEIRLTNPGTLEDKMPQEMRNRVRLLHIEGPMDYKDFKFIKRLCERSRCEDSRGKKIDNYIDLELERARIMSSDNGGLLGDHGERDVLGNSLSYATHLRSIWLPERLKRIDSGALRGCSHLEEVIIPTGVRSLGNSAFSGCSRLKFISMPEGLERIGDDCFYDCTDLNSVTIPGSVTEIGDNAFKDSGLTRVSLPYRLEVLGAKAFEGTQLVVLDIPARTRITNNDLGMMKKLEEISVENGSRYYTHEEGVLYDNTGRALLLCPMARRGTFTVPDDVEEIASCAFAGSALSNVNLPAALSLMGEYAFSGSSVTDVVLPEGLGSIPTGAFKNCAKLLSIEFPQGLSMIGESAFENCTNLRSIDLPEGVTDLSQRAFKQCKGLAEVCFPAALTSIGKECFEGCALKSIDLPSTLTTLGERAFKSCKGLTNVTLPDLCTTVGKEAFCGCTSLTAIDLGSGVTSIGDHALRETAISILVLPESVRELGKKVAEKCKSLTRIECHAIVPPALGDVSNKKIEVYVPATSVDAYHNAKHWKDFNKYIKPLE